ITEFVKKGGNFVTTYFSGIVNENDLCFLGGFPGPLREVTGIWAEEIDTLDYGEYNEVDVLGKSYKAVDYCELIHTQTAKTLGNYATDFYKGMSAVTENCYGDGKAYFIAFRDEGDFVCDFYKDIASKMNLERAIEVDLPTGVTARARYDTTYKYVFVQNFNNNEVKVNLAGICATDMETGENAENELCLSNYGIKILKIKLSYSK
ncbi:MAG: beta-galactosidase trimerization domain-containing protein, partial [Oscillospiraceae bacterium]